MALATRCERRERMYGRPRIMPPPLPWHVKGPTVGRDRLFLYSTPVVAAVVSVVIIGSVLALLPRRHSPAIVADSAIAVAAAEQPGRIRPR